MNTKTAILIFTYSAKKEAEKKTFRFSKEMFEALNEQTIQIAEKSGLPYFVFTEKQQIGRTFGERFTNAIQAVYNKGFHAVITIGNDTPHLRTRHILKTAQKLEKHGVVLGPSTDGGFYIMGLKKSQFNAKAFLELPWQTAQLNSCISKLNTANNTDVSYLEVLSDIDILSDIKTVLQDFKPLFRRIKKGLLKCLFIEKRLIFNLFSNYTTYSTTLLFNKGSPL